MAIKITLKNSVVQDSVPTTSHLAAVGELALNANINSLGIYMRASDNSIVKMAGPGSVTTPAASTTAAGIAELATSAETTTGTDTARVTTPAGVKAVTDAERTTSNNTYLALAGGTLTGVVAATAGSNSAPAIHFGDSDSGIYGGTNTVSLAAGGIQGLTLNASAEVNVPVKLGVNTASPAKALHVTSTGEVARFQSTNSSATVRLYSTASDHTELGHTGDFYIAVGGSERARIDASGRLLVGLTSARTLNSGYTPSLQVEGNTATTSSISAINNINQTGGPSVWLGKSRGAALGGVTTVQSGDELGSIFFNGADGTDIQSIGASIVAKSNGTVAGNRMPGELLFATTADSAGSVAPTTRLTIDSAGKATFTVDASINSISIGKGANSVAGNTVLGENALDAAVTGTNNTAIGYAALTANTSGTGNTAIGKSAGYGITTATDNTALGRSTLTATCTGASNTAVGATALNANTSGAENTTVGAGSLLANTTGSSNVAVGTYALDANTTAAFNTAIGRSALSANTTANSNTAVGYYSLYANTTGAWNTAVGGDALYANTTGDYNVAVGGNSLTVNTTGYHNIAVGYEALEKNNGNANIAIGFQALEENTTGASNVAVGYTALDANTTGNYNIGMGHGALGASSTGSNNISIGYGSLGNNSTASNNTAVGHNALHSNTTASNNTAVGKNAGDAITDGYENTIIGSGTDADNGSRTRAVALGCNVSTHPANYTFRVEGTGGAYHTGNTTVWSTTSDERIKKDIVDSSVGLAAINQVKIRNFKYRTPSEITASELQEYDLDQLAINDTRTKVGVIAQEFETVFPNAIKTDDRGIKNVCDDEMLFAMVKAIQELSAKVTALEAG